MRFKNRLKVFSFCVTMSLAVAMSGGAQDSSIVLKKNCWRGRPAPTCDQFLLTEFNFFRAIVNPSRRYTATYGIDSNSTTVSYEIHRSDWKFSAEIGGMLNHGKKNAFGGTLLIDGGPDGASVGLKGRYRRWLTPEGIALDVGAGFQSTRDEIPYDYVNYSSLQNSYRGPQNSLGFTGDVAINAMDYVAVVTRVDINKMGGKLKPTISLGARAESRPAVFAIAGVGVTFGVLIALLFAAFDDFD